MPAISDKKAKLTGTNQGSEVPGMIFKICSKEEVPKLLDTLAANHIVGPVQKGTDSGGSGAKFIVRWESTEPVNPPLIEAIMISTKSQQGISFISRGQAINE